MRRWIGLVSTVFGLVGCAKFPANGTSSDFTHLIFRFRLAAPIDPHYIYGVAIRPIMDGDPTSVDLDGHGPVPVIRVGSKNGYVEGWPTRFIQFDESVKPFYLVYRFPPREVTTEDDNPRNLGAKELFSQAADSNFIDPRPISNDGVSYGKDLGFEITTRDLVDSEADAQKIRHIQFNILTMNKDALASTADRVMDALGDPSTFERGYTQRFVKASNTFTNTGSTIPERPDDTYPVNLPSVDIVDWSLEIRTP